jgi:predicted DNA-binding transcriptional regulator YafY
MNNEDAIAINKAMLASDDHVLEVRYTDRDGVVTQRTISPIKYVSDNAILALCLGRETPRRFDLNRMSSIKLVDAGNVLMPVEIKVVYDPDGSNADIDTNGDGVPETRLSDRAERV